MKQSLLNIFHLSVKELKSLFTDPIMLVLIVTVYTVSNISVFYGTSVGVKNAVVAFVDKDDSRLSRMIRTTARPPYFKDYGRKTTREESEALMRDGEATFVMDIPENFERDLMGGRNPKIQLMIDATAITQAGVGSGYLMADIESLVAKELGGAKRGKAPVPPFSSEFRFHYDATLNTAIRNTVVQAFLNTGILAIILIGAAFIREREHGTLEHLLVMPVKAHEIALAKIAANGLVILVASLLSLKLVIEWFLGIRLPGSFALFAFGSFLFLFSSAALGMLLALGTPNMPQFGISAMLLIIVLHLITGAQSPIESMPAFMQKVVFFAPDTHFISSSIDIIFKEAKIQDVAMRFIYMLLIGLAFMWIALARFKNMLEKRN